MGITRGDGRSSAARASATSWSCSRDGAHFGLDLTYRYQRGALGIAHAIGLARDFVGDEAFCVVLGDNILRGPTLADVAREFEHGPWGAGTLLYRVPDPERFGVAELDAQGNVIGFEEKPAQPKSDLIPIGVYFLRPDAFDVIDHLAPVRPRRVRDHRRAQPLHPRPAGSSRRVYEGHWTDAGTVPSARCAAAELRRRRRTPTGALAPPTRATPIGATDARPIDRLPTSPHLLVTGGAGFIGSAFVRDILGRRRRDAHHRPRQA